MRKPDETSTVPFHDQAMAADVAIRSTDRLRDGQLPGFARLVTSLAARFLNATNQTVGDHIHRTLRDLGHFTGANSCYLYQFSQDAANIVRAHLWGRQCGLPSEREAGWATGQFPIRLDNLCWHDAAHPLPEGTSEQTKIERQRLIGEHSIKTLINVPLLASGGPVGALGVVSTKRRLNLDEESLALLKTLGQVLASALDRLRTEAAFLRAHEHLEERMEVRTRELAEANARLELEQEALRNRTVALQEVLGQVEAGRKELASQTQANADKIAMPILDILCQSSSGPDEHYLRLLRSCLKDITAPMAHYLDRTHPELTPREQEICHMVREGFRCKDIAAMLHISVQTVLKQRKAIRRKLGLARKKINLASYLRSLG